MALIIVFTNDTTGKPPYGNYNVGVFLNETAIWKGRVEGHDRRAGWIQLVRDLVAIYTNGKVSDD